MAATWLRWAAVARATATSWLALTATTRSAAPTLRVSIWSSCEVVMAPVRWSAARRSVSLSTFMRSAWTAACSALTAAMARRAATVVAGRRGRGRMGRVHAGLGARHPRLPLGEQRLGLGAVELDQELARFDRVPLAHVHRGDARADARRDVDLGPSMVPVPPAGAVRYAPSCFSRTVRATASTTHSTRR